MAQDVITKKDGGKIIGRITNVSDESISYTIESEGKFFSFDISKQDVLSIKYKDGSVEYFDKSALSPPSEVKELDIIHFHNGSYIEVIVDSISDTHFFYRDYGIPDGVLKSVKSDLISQVDYNANSKFRRKTKVPVAESKPEIKKETPSQIKPEPKQGNRFYVTGGYGQSFHVFKQLLGENIERGKIDNNSFKRTSQVYGTYGEGTHWNAGCGILFRERFGIELNYLSFEGTKVNISNTNMNKSTSGNWSITETVNTNAYSEYKAINGSFIFKYKWFYSRIGIVGAQINVFMDSTYSRDYENLSPLRDSIRTSKTQFSSDKVQCGFIGGIGIQIPLGKNFRLFGESNIQMLNMQADRMSYIEVSEQGIIKKNPSDITFETSSNENNGESLKRNFPIYSCGWNAGIRILF